MFFVLLQMRAPQISLIRFSPFFPVLNSFLLCTIIEQESNFTGWYWYDGMQFHRQLLFTEVQWSNYWNSFHEKTILFIWLHVCVLQSFTATEAEMQAANNHILFILFRSVWKKYLCFVNAGSCSVATSAPPLHLICFHHSTL